MWTLHEAAVCAYAFCRISCAAAGAVHATNLGIGLLPTPP